MISLMSTARVWTTGPATIYLLYLAALDAYRYRYQVAAI
jgi:hypothetical protein